LALTTGAQLSSLVCSTQTLSPSSSHPHEVARFETGVDRHGGFIDQMHIKAVKALADDECCLPGAHPARGRAKRFWAPAGHQLHPSPRQGPAAQRLSSAAHAGVAGELENVCAWSREPLSDTRSACVQHALRAKNRYAIYYWLKAIA
jgi:hypothetical protein